MGILKDGTLLARPRHSFLSPLIEHRTAVVPAAVEGFVLDVLRSIKIAIETRPETSKQVAKLYIRDPRDSVIVEDGSFMEGTMPQRCLPLSRGGFRRIARLYGALDVVHQLRLSGRSATLRELFYRMTAEAPALFCAQPHMDAAMRDAVGALRIGRPHLGVFSTEKGLVAGAVTFHDSQGSVLASVACSAGGVSVSEVMLAVDDAQIQIGAAHCVLVVEKDTFFQHLLQGRLLAVLPIILVTGRGYPDMLTRRLLQRLHRIAPGLPQAYLGDYDPHGISIFLIFRASCPWLRWVGMHSADVAMLPKRFSLELTKRDHALRQSLLRSLDDPKDNSITAELLAMGHKFELEALHAVQGTEQLVQSFVPGKLLRRGWL